MPDVNRVLGQMRTFTEVSAIDLDMHAVLIYSFFSLFEMESGRVSHYCTAGSILIACLGFSGEKITDVVNIGIGGSDLVCPPICSYSFPIIDSVSLLSSGAIHGNRSPQTIWEDWP